MKLTERELDFRVERFARQMDIDHPDWDSAIFAHKVNQYYFTGTMQDAILIFRRGKTRPSLYVRRSYERAASETVFPAIYPMNSYRDAAEREGGDLGNTYMELEIAPYAMIQRIQKHFKMRSLSSLENTIMYVRSRKTEYELYWQKQASAQHHKVLTEAVPALLREGMSEAEFVGELFAAMVRYGYQGITRFYRFGTELIAGQIGFGVNSLCPSSFDGPGGALGYGPAAPVAGNRDTFLKKGDLVFVDNGFSINGYNSDKTQVYMFGGKPTPETVSAHERCIEIQLRAAEMLRPGAIPSDIYRTVMQEIDAEFLQNFMGFGERKVSFLGHGIGLQVDEMPVIAEGVDRPLEENMTIALEPKKGIDGVGMVGVEDTFLVTKNGGVCLTGYPSKIIEV